MLLFTINNTSPVELCRAVSVGEVILGSNRVIADTVAIVTKRKVKKQVTIV